MNRKAAVYSRQKCFRVKKFFLLHCQYNESSQASIGKNEMGVGWRKGAEKI